MRAKRSLSILALLALTVSAALAGLTPTATHAQSANPFVYTQGAATGTGNVTAIASCPDGTSVIGGGFNSDDENFGITANRPIGTSQWEVDGTSVSGVNNANLTAYATCIPSSMVPDLQVYSNSATIYSVYFPKPHSATVDALCPSGKSLVGGGFNTSDIDVGLWHSTPGGEGWEVQAQVYGVSDTEGEYEIDSYALCTSSLEVAGVQQVTNVSPIAEYKTLTTQCPFSKGYWPIGAGFGSKDAKDSIFPFSRPDGTTASEWDVQMDNGNFFESVPFLSFGLCASVTSTGSVQTPPPLTTILKDTDDHITGTVSIRPAHTGGTLGTASSKPNGLAVLPLGSTLSNRQRQDGQYVVDIQVAGLPSGTHDVGFHEVGSCKGAGKRAGFGSVGERLNIPLSDLQVRSNGSGEVRTTTKLSLTKGEDALLDEDGASIVLSHGGEPVACGVFNSAASSVGAPRHAALGRR